MLENMLIAAWVFEHLFDIMETQRDTHLKAHGYGEVPRLGTVNACAMGCVPEPHSPSECIAQMDFPLLASRRGLSRLTTETELDPYGSLNLVENRLIFISKWTTAWHHSVKAASLKTHLLQSLRSKNNPHSRPHTGHTY